MKFLLIFALCVSLSFASNEFSDEFDEESNEVSKEIKFKVPKETLDGLKSDLDNAVKIVGGTTAVINEYADKILANLEKFVYHAGLDPLMLPDINQKFLAEKVVLNLGNLQGLAKMHRYGDVNVVYSTQKKILEVDVPIAFEDIYFGYDYLMKILFISYKGGMEGKIENFRIKMVFTIDFNTYHVGLKSNDVMNSGHVSLHFTGHVIDIIINILSEFVTTILHPMIVGIIQLSMSQAVNKVSNEINGIIDHVFHPPSNVSSVTYF